MASDQNTHVSYAGSEHYCQGISNNGLDIVEILMVIVSLTGLCVAIYVTFHSLQYLPKSKKLAKPPKISFYCCLICSYIVFISSAISAFICLLTDVYENFLNSMAIISFTILILILLITLIYRLFSSFATSSYAVKGITKWIFYILYSIILICAILNIIERCLVAIKFNGDWNAAAKQYPFTASGYVGFIGLLLYISTSIYAVFLFIKKLMELTKSQMQSTMDITNIKLSNSQKKILNNASKYVSLLALAIFTSILTAVGWSLSTFIWDPVENYNTWNSYLEEIMILITAIDTIVNLICLYLQFGFTSKYYNKWCCGLQCCWHKALTMNVMNSVSPTQFTKVETNPNSEDEF